LVAWVGLAFRLSEKEVVIGSLLVVASGYMYGALEFGAISAFVALLVFAYWQSLRHVGIEVGGGLALGLAISLKIFPAIFLVVAVVRRSRKAMAWALGSAFTLGVVGLLWFDGTSSSGFLETLSLASQQWIPFVGNISLAGVLSSAGLAPGPAAAVALSCGVLWVSLSWRKGDHLDRAMTILTVAVLVTWPVVWGHYMFLGVAAAGYLWKSGQTAARYLAATWLVAWVVRPAVLLSIEVAPALSQVSALAIQLLLVAAVHVTRSEVAEANSELKVPLLNQPLVAD
jgi:hypothetical protein